jgi:hypothetical protein
MPEKAILQGDLSKIQLPDVLSFVAMIRHSGKLVVRGGGLERTIHWTNGEIVFASSGSPEHSLGQFLLRNGKISQEQYEESKRFTPQERAEINKIGQTSGCHTCGTTNPGTKSGNFVPDHQPPSAINPPGQPQKLYPHCIECSRKQGGQVLKFLKDLAKAIIPGI